MWKQVNEEAELDFPAKQAASLGFTKDEDMTM